MRIIDTSVHQPEDIPTQTERDWIYNGLDCAVTWEVLQVLEAQLDEVTTPVYDFSRALQGPVLEMNMRGCLVDQRRKKVVLDEFFTHLDVLNDNLERIVEEGTGLYGFNWRSNPDMQTLLYGKLGLPPRYTKTGNLTVDRKALEAMEQYLVAYPIIQHVKAMRDIAKKISVLKTAIDADGRIRTSYNIAATDTGRFSSSYSEFGTGGNLQNVEESLRSIFIPNPGYKFAKFDAKSGESFVVGAIEWNLFADDKYLRACETGDPHTAAARMCWPNLEWTGDLKKDKDIAETPGYRHHTYRFLCKKIGHGSNYGGQPDTLSKQSNLPTQVVSDFQTKYFRAFPAHLRWHAWVENEIWTKGVLTSLTGRRRWFFGRRGDQDTLRAAIAYDPQGSLADIVNDAMLRLWRERIAILMFQDHDALTFMYPEEREDEVVPKLWQLLPHTRLLNRGRELRIPYDCKVGWNKGDYDPKHPDKNPHGLKDYDPNVGDKRKRPEEVNILDRRLR